MTFDDWWDKEGEGIIKDVLKADLSNERRQDALRAWLKLTFIQGVLKGEENERDAERQRRFQNRKPPAKCPLCNGTGYRNKNPRDECRGCGATGIVPAE